MIEWATRVLRDAAVPCFRDPAGNLIVGAASAAAYRRLARRKSAEPLRLFIAHMDHPGFHGVRWRASGRLAVRWHGGSPVRHLRGSRVWLADDSGFIGHGRLTRVRLDHARRALRGAEVRLDAAARPRRPKAATLYGGFDFRAPVRRAGKKIYTRAADDLVGVFAVVATALDLFSRRTRAGPPFLGLLTRAEEVGFVGAVSHLELGWLAGARRPIVGVSLEASRALPNAEIGRGPVVRLGDRRTVFDAGCLQVLTERARAVLPGRHQRRIMDGGACEATVATAWGLPAIGLCVPLGNYHNQHAVRGGPAPEYVHLGDVEGMLVLCRALLRPGLAWGEPWKQQRRRLRRGRRRYRLLLCRG